MAPETTTMTVRWPTFGFADLPRKWLTGSAVATHAGNAGHVCIPVGEEVFIDSVRGFAPGLIARQRLLQATVGVMGTNGSGTADRDSRQSRWPIKKFGRSRPGSVQTLVAGVCGSGVPIAVQ